MIRHRSRLARKRGIDYKLKLTDGSSRTCTISG